jgi:hypothetical protein
MLGLCRQRAQKRVPDHQRPVLSKTFLVKDPARKVTVPSQLRDTDKTTLT